MKVLLTILLISMVCVGCVDEDVEPFYTQDKLMAVEDKVQQAITHKEGYLVHAQLGTPEGLQVIKGLMDCSKVGSALLDEGHDELGEILIQLGLAGSYLDMWIETDDATYYTKAAAHYNTAEELWADY